MEDFRKLGISKPILRAIEEEKFDEPSEIQEKSIPLILAGKDVIAGSATGSGKTLAFGSRIIQNSEKGAGIQALVLTPTRELAEQVSKALKKFSKYHPIRVISIYGGVSINPQISGLRHADIVVGTPGRILDHMERRTIDFKKLKVLVLDEADRMFDMGFAEDVQKIISQCPVKRQTLLFSATIYDEIKHLAKKYMNHPVSISAESNVDPSKLAQMYYDVPNSLKFSLLVHLLKNEKSHLVMVFCNTRKYVDFVGKNLKLNGIDALAIHGGFSQDKRTRVMEQFHSKKVFVLVCTDVAARGLDIKGISHIYNYDIPKDAKEYIHRIGRTARAGKEGMAINLLSDRDHDNFSRVYNESETGIRKKKTPFLEKVRTVNVEDRQRRGSFGHSRRGPSSQQRGRGSYGHHKPRGPPRHRRR
ncbi:MAG: DEAD/DEAH box helicase [Candidatus Woesearchaeota archaeon]|jgi:ATP-dependent RNA helicase DeaD|nr:DEAD/DEAH box helicase [Candidatus Woesearchaeota archaeon]|tara:strand:+ start:1883 stop:3133 length:1251 start_codon:yes stop_codon:yes gene_type:complete